MTSKKQSPANQTKLARLALYCDEVFDEVLRSGFHGLARLELTVADGTIQRICRVVERVDKER